MNKAARKLERRFRRYEFPLLLGLALLWVVLWREFSVISVFSGLAVAVAITRFFYLPPVEIAATFRPLRVLRFFAYFLWEVAVASVQVAWVALRPKPVPKSSIIAVPLRTTSDFILTATGLTISLIPGSYIVDVDRDEHTLFLHVLAASDDAATAKMREDVYRVEKLLIEAVGNRSDREAISS